MRDSTRPPSFGDQQQGQDDDHDGGDHGLGRREKTLTLDVVDAQQRLAQPGLLRPQPDHIVRRDVALLQLQQRLSHRLDRCLAVAGVAGVDVGPQRCHHGDEPLPESAQVGLPPHLLERLGFAQDRVEAGRQVGGRSLGVAVVGQRAGDHEPHDEDPTGHDAGGEWAGGDAFKAEVPQHRPDGHEGGDDYDCLDGHLVVAKDLAHRDTSLAGCSQPPTVRR